MRIIETFLRGQQPKHKPTPIPPKIVTAQVGRQR
jgi:hypothetical protein